MNRKPTDKEYEFAQKALATWKLGPTQVWTLNKVLDLREYPDEEVKMNAAQWEVFDEMLARA